MSSMKKVFGSIALILVAGGVYWASAQRRMPTGEEIARAAKAGRLNPRDSATAEEGGKKIAITSMDSSKIKTSTDLEKGQVVAVIDVEGVAELPNGTYNLFLVKLNDHWQVLFESGGKIVKRDRSVEVNSTEPDHRKVGAKPEIVMAPNVPPEICFWFHTRWCCIELNPLHWADA